MHDRCPYRACHALQVIAMSTYCHSVVGLQPVHLVVSQATLATNAQAIVQLLAPEFLLQLAEIATNTLLDMSNAFFFLDGHIRAIWSSITHTFETL